MDARSVDIVLHWLADKKDTPEVTVFDNDLNPLAIKKARLTVAHTAVVPPADVRVDRKVLFANIANGEFVSADVPAGSYSVDVVPTGQTGHALFGPVTLPVTANNLTRVFAIGQPKDHSMDAIVQTLPLRTAGSPAPDLVGAGTAGLVSTAVRADLGRFGASSTRHPTPWWPAVALLVLIAGALASASIRRPVRRRQLKSALHGREA